MSTSEKILKAFSIMTIALCVVCSIGFFSFLTIYGLFCGIMCLALARVNFEMGKDLK